MKVKVFVSAIAVLVFARLIWFRAGQNQKKTILTPLERCTEEGTRPEVCACIYEKMQKEVTPKKVDGFRKDLKNNNFSGEQILQIFNQIKKECLK